MSVLSTWWIFLLLLVGFILDRLIGDPSSLPHPIRWMGNAIYYFEPRVRTRIKDEYWAGLFFAGSLILGCFLLCSLIAYFSFLLHPFLGFVVQAIMIFYSLASRSLSQAAEEIYQSLQEKEVDLARSQVAMIVGRDVSAYDADDIARATVETVAENYVDGVFSPLFFAAIGGGPLALTYKMVNTLDSMVGYKNDKYLYFGRAAAKIDDAVNYIPARLAVLMISCAAMLLSLAQKPFSGQQAFSLALAEGRQHSSPNAGYPEAAFAGAMQVRMGGPNYYGGKLVEKPYIGSRFSPPLVKDIPRACTLMQVASFLGCVTLCLVLVCFILI